MPQHNQPIVSFPIYLALRIGCMRDGACHTPCIKAPFFPVPFETVKAELPILESDLCRFTTCADPNEFEAGLFSADDMAGTSEVLREEMPGDGA